MHAKHTELADKRVHDDLEDMGDDVHLGGGYRTKLFRILAFTFDE